MESATEVRRDAPAAVSHRRLDSPSRHLRTARSARRIEVLQAAVAILGPIVMSPIDETRARAPAWADDAGPAPWRQPGDDARHPQTPARALWNPPMPPAIVAWIRLSASGH